MKQVFYDFDVRFTIEGFERIEEEAGNTDLLCGLWRDEQDVIEIQTIRDDSAPVREYVTQCCERAEGAYISPPIKMQGEYTYVCLEIRKGYMADLYFQRSAEILHVKQPYYIPMLKHIDLWIKQKHIGPETKPIEHILFNEPP